MTSKNVAVQGWGKDTMTNAEKREAARQFVNKWHGRGKEDEDDRSFWFDIMQNVMGQTNVTDRIQFQKKVIGHDGNTKRIDAYIEETKVLIEQKSLGIDLDKPQAGHDGMTPFEQARMYNDLLPHSEKARWIVVSNFAEIRIHDMDTRKPEENYSLINLTDLLDKLPMLDFIVKEQVQKINEELELSIKAGELVGMIHDRFEEQYNDPMAVRTQHSLNILCVRLVFCLYAEDAGLFGDTDAFQKYLEQYDPKDIRRALLDLFKVLNTPEDERGEMYLDDELAAFPYCNGGLFARENIEIPKITQEIKDVILDAALFDWSKISPTIFGAVFESTLNPETRRAGGMHYTSIENIHKVIDPLFLDDLKTELAEIKAIQVKKTKVEKLQAFQNKLASLKFLDPAAGSGNFLTETYVSVRRLENEAISEIYGGQIVMGTEDFNPIKVGIDQFYGIEINDYAVSVAKAALWIAESQMMIETSSIVQMNAHFLPLKTNATIIEGNALQLDWERIIRPAELAYIIGNPPFIGARLMSVEQKADVNSVFGTKWKNVGNLDYVACWYKKCAEYIRGTTIRAALVSTNSISQGEAVTNLWKPLFDMGVHIDFAHRTFIWDSEASIKAHVHCVIIGFSEAANSNARFIFEGDKKVEATNINGYLVDANNVFAENRKKPICDVPEIVFGSMANDSGFFVLTREEKDELLSKEPLLTQVIRPFLGSAEFINNRERYCIWLKNVAPNVIRSSPELLSRVENVRMARASSNRVATQKLAETPSLFGEIRQPEEGMYLLIPRVSSERRRYVPMGFLPSEIVASDAVQIVPSASIYHFGILTSNVHMSWMRTVAGRLKSDYRYSGSIVYNNFPWSTPTDEQKAKIEETAQAILDARALYPDSSLADLYDPLTMPIELKKAHQANDRAVMQAYGFDVKTMSEADCVAELMKMYQKLVDGGEQ